jgi:Icc-related predicted phosphoesterase
MKFALASDLHLEFGVISLHNTENADVLILSGDICVARDVLFRDTYNIRGENDKSNKIHTFFQECCERFPNVIYVLGNHEHYHGDFIKSIRTLRDNLSYLDNLHILEKEFIDLDGVVFFGGTLWTNMNNECPKTLSAIRVYMNDFRIIKNSSNLLDNYGSIGNLKPEDVVAEHKATLKQLSDAIDSRPNDNFIVVGHHAPSRLSTNPKYADQVIVNGAYSSDLSEFILDRPQIKVWTHGHTHSFFDYFIGDTRIICNPRGYIDYEPEAEFFKLQFFEI